MFRFEEDTQFLHEPRLQFLHTGKALFAHAAQTVLIGSPLFCGALVATEVDIGEGEYLGYMAKHTLEEVDYLVLAHVEHVV